ncbi:hypothetical protein ABBQ38_009182 [Trebouxia sp. C0009 RCD-2024]
MQSQAQASAQSATQSQNPWLARKPLLKQRSYFLSKAQRSNSHHQAVKHRPCTQCQAAGPNEVADIAGAGAQLELDQQQQQQQQQSTDQRKEFLYEPRFGLPLVRRRLSYGDLLREIRTGNVKQLKFFETGENVIELEGPCLVVFQDDTVAQGYVPHYDYRIPYAMENHGVAAARLPAEPAPERYNVERMWNKNQQKIINYVIPVIAIGLVYFATQLAAKWKGDKEDREKMRAMDAEKVKAEKAQRKADDALMEPARLAARGMTLEQIETDMKRRGIKMERSYIQRQIEKADRKRAVEEDEPFYAVNSQAAEQAQKLREARKEQANLEGNVNDMERAQDFLKAGNVKVKRVIDPEAEALRLAEMRRLQRQMKGVKLQYIAEDDTVFFDDVAGIGEAKSELMEVVDFFLKPQRFKKSGARIPKGVLLCGPPGTGKTLLARAVAGEAGVNFLSINASEFVEMFVGVGASRVRDLFKQARGVAPAIIFIDEIDAVGRTRGGAQGNDERDTTLNQMLSEMDGFGEGVGVIVMAATNRKDVLDPALIRPGRFDRIIQVGLPDLMGRVETFQTHLRKRGGAVAEDVTEKNLRELAFDTQRYSGAAIANLVNLAAMRAERDGREQIQYKDLTDALQYDRLGPDRAPYSAGRQKRLAVQEAATALVCTMLPAIEPVVHVTIKPREKYPLGQTVLRVNEQRELTKQFTRQYLEEQLLTTLAGRAAEELVYGEDEMSTINQRRIVMARRIVQKLTVAAAMVDNPDIGPRTISTPVRRGGKSLKQIVTNRVTYDTHLSADLHMQVMLIEAYAVVKELLERNRAALDLLIEGLIQATDQQLDGTEVRDIIEKNGNSGDLQYREQNQTVFA